MTLDSLAGPFEQNRTHLRGVAYRMLGSLSDAEDAVQEAWLRLSRADTAAVENLTAWLTTVVARISLDMLRARKTRTELLEHYEPPPHDGHDPEREAVLADSVGLAMLVVLDRLPPAERVAFVLHDMFGMPFEEIAPIVERSADAARQLASRGRNRVQVETGLPETDREDHRRIADAFLAASRDGNLDALLAVLDPDVVFRTDAGASPSGKPVELRGAQNVARGSIAFASRAQASRAALIDGSVGILVAPLGRLYAVTHVRFAGGRIAEMELVTDPARIRQMQVAVLAG